MDKHRLRASARGCLKSRSVFSDRNAGPAAELCRRLLTRLTLVSLLSAGLNSYLALKQGPCNAISTK